MENRLIKMKKISKSFNDVKVLDNVDFEINRGEIVGLIGENGAGKSTLMNILSGVIKKDSGEIYIKNKLENFKDPHHANLLGINTIHQELNLFLNMSVADNIYMGNELSKGNSFLIDKNKMKSGAEIALQKVGLKIDVNKKVEELSVAQMQLVEIDRALLTKSRLIIMDEPTSSLAGEEIKILRNIIVNLKKEGVSIIFITHKLVELFDIADKVVVLRDGKNSGVIYKKDFSYDLFIKKMVGKEIDKESLKEESDRIHNEVCFEVNNLSTKFLKNINIKVGKGEILGITGPVGSGRSEIMRAIFGIDKVTSGEFYLDGSKVNCKNPYESIKNRIGLLPEDRKLQGLILNLNVRKNLTLNILRHISSFGIIDNKSEKNIFNKYKNMLSIKVANDLQQVKNLSGGNQQKVCLSKWMAIKPVFLMLDEPTKGVDVGAKQEIYKIILDMARQGITILLSTSDIEEILLISDRLVVLYEGKVKGELNPYTSTAEDILKMAIK